MSDRVSSPQRREQIVSATLALLAEAPLHALSTRRIARAVGISQPALFRHFRSRDAIVLAALEQVQGQLGAAAATILSVERPPLSALESLVIAAAGWAGEMPGLPRLLFYDGGAQASSPFRAPLRRLVSSQQAMMGELIRQAQERGALPADLDAQRSGQLLLATLQGLLLQRQLSGEPADLRPAAAALFEAWLAGATAGAPRVRERSPSASPPRKEGIVAIDVRPILAGGLDPLEAVLEALDRVSPDGLLKVVSPFRPAPLLALLQGRGLTVQAREIGGAWDIQAARPGAPAILDLRALEAPAPMQRALEAAAGLAPGLALLARTPRPPRLLLPILAERGLRWSLVEEPDGAGLLHIRRPAAP